MQLYAKKTAALAVALVLIAGGIVFGAGGQETPATTAGETASAKNITLSGEGTKVQQAMQGGSDPFTPIELYNEGYAFPGEQVKLVFWDYMSERLGRIELLKEIAEEYAAIHPNVEIDVQMIPWKGSKAKYKTAFEAGTAPEIITWNPADTVPFELVIPAPTWVEECAEGEFVDQSLHQGSYLDDYWGPLVNAQIGQFMYYNKDMFKAKGLNPDKYPETLPQVLDYAKKLTETQAGEVVVAGMALRHMGQRGGMAGKWLPYLWPFIDSTKGTHYNEDYSDVIFDSPEHKDALAFYGELMHKHKIASTKLPMPGESFQFKRAAMIYRESPWISRFQQHAPDLDFGVAPLANGAAPYGQYQVPTTTGRTAHTTMVSNQCPPEYQDVAFDFLMFINTGDRELRLSRMETSRAQWKGNVAIRAEEVLFAEVAEIMSTRPIKRFETEPRGYGAEVGSYVGEAIERVFAGETDAGTALDDAAKKARELLKQ